MRLSLGILCILGLTSLAAAPPARILAARASQLDPAARPHPEIDFLFEREGKPADMQKALCNPNNSSRGQLVIWLMGYNAPLFDELGRDGFHVIQIHYANQWFSKLTKTPPADGKDYIGNIRLEAVTGQDHSPHITIPQPDGAAERARRFLLWLAREHPEGNWEQYLTADTSTLVWDKIVLAGASHGATTAARWALHQKVARVVMFCGPRDQFESWQALPSATPSERFFGFSHVLDEGWSASHYCRSWQLLGLCQHGPLVDVEKAPPPYQHTRRLITAADVSGDVKRAHNAVQPGGAAVKNADGSYLHAPVWHYLFTSSSESHGPAVSPEPDCCLTHRP